MPRRLPALFEKSQHLSNLASYLLLSAMMVCVSITYIQLLQWITRSVGDFHWDYLPYLVFLVVLESIFTRPIARELEGREKFIYHAAEWVTFTVLLKIIYYTFHGFDQLSIDLPRWQADFIVFFEGDFFFSFLFIIYAWWIARVSADDLEELNTDPADIHWEVGQLQNNRLNVRATLTSRLLWNGTIMVALAAVTHISMSAVLGPDAAIGPVINIVVYFFLALVLFSQIQFAFLRGRWFWHQTPIAPALTSTWIRYSFLFFAALAVISFLLPTSYSMGLLDTLNYVLNWLISALIFLVQLLLLPILWLLSIAGCTRQPNVPAAEPESQPFVPPEQTPPPSPLPWLELLQSILFWGLFLVVVIYSLAQFVRQNPQMVELIKRLRFFNWGMTLLKWLRNWLTETGTRVGGLLIEARRQIFTGRISAITRQIRPELNFRQRTPRQQIIFYYLSLVDRGGEHGLKRKDSQTPYQYAQNLAENLPEVQEDIAGFTDTFMEARYSKHEIDPQQSSLVQRFWRNIMRSLNRVYPTQKK